MEAAWFYPSLMPLVRHTRLEDHTWISSLSWINDLNHLLLLISFTWTCFSQLHLTCKSQNFKEEKFLRVLSHWYTTSNGKLQNTVRGVSWSVSQKCGLIFDCCHRCLAAILEPRDVCCCWCGWSRMSDTHTNKECIYASSVASCEILWSSEEPDSIISLRALRPTPTSRTLDSQEASYWRFLDFIKEKWESGFSNV